MTTRYNPNNGTGRWYEDVEVKTPVREVDTTLVAITVAILAISLLLIVL